MAAKTLATYISELSAGSSLGAGDKIPTLEGGAMVYFEGDDFGGGVAWGAITGTLSSQTDLNTALGTKQASDQDLTDISALTPTNDDFLQRKAGAWANRTVAQVKTDLGVPTYLRYVALLTQTGTDAPVATVLENTLGGTVVWSYSAVGTYLATLAGAFTENKTWFSTSAEYNTDFVPFYNIYRVSDNQVRLLSPEDANGNLTNGWSRASIEIRVYP